MTALVGGTVERTFSGVGRYARNARTHSDVQVDQIAASIREWGWTNPVLAAEDQTIIAGHGRVLAARKLKIEQVPVLVATGWSEAQKKAYALADNKLALNGGWDRNCSGSNSANWRFWASTST
jgi:ParB-like chromosome segregation protein Spo0J